MTARDEAADPERSRFTSSVVWQDTDRMRKDHIDNYSGLAHVAGKRYVLCENCEKPGHRLRYYEGMPRVIVHLETGPSEFETDAACAFDLRLLGMIPESTGIYYAVRLDKFIGGSIRRDVRVTTENRHGIDCRVVRFRGNLYLYEFWFDPQRGHHPIFLEVKLADDPECFGLHNTLEVTPQLVAPGIWFPARTVLTEYGRGGQVYNREIVEVTDVVVNEPIPSSVFTLAGVGIEEGRHVDVGQGVNAKSMVWKGGKLVPFETVLAEKQAADLAAGIMPVVPQAVRVDVPAAGAGRGWWYAGAGGLAVVGAGLVWWAVRRRG